MASSERFSGANVIDAGRLSPYWGEHAARYLFAHPFIEDKTVLDIACGSGYGVSLMSSKARFVIGVDVDADAAKDAARECRDNAAILLGNGLGLPFGDGTFDVITSFETVEHIHNRRTFLSELRRVLRSGGMLILSTPNANYTEPVNGKPANPFHVHEYTPEELWSELAAHFPIDRFLGQTLSDEIRVPPLLAGQRRLPRDFRTQTRLVCWKAFNKIPVRLREQLSELIWHKPFYPTEVDYNFCEDSVAVAPVLLAVCRKS
jgi:SAM-dependent methyltransferase